MIYDNRSSLYLWTVWGIHIAIWNERYSQFDTIDYFIFLLAKLRPIKFGTNLSEKKAIWNRIQRGKKNQKNEKINSYLEVSTEFCLNLHTFCITYRCFLLTSQLFIISTGPKLPIKHWSKNWRHEANDLFHVAIESTSLDAP